MIVLSAFISITKYAASILEPSSVWEKRSSDFSESLPRRVLGVWISGFAKGRVGARFGLARGRPPKCAEHDGRALRSVSSATAVLSVRAFVEERRRRPLRVLCRSGCHRANQPPKIWLRVTPGVVRAHEAEPRAVASCPGVGSACCWGPASPTSQRIAGRVNGATGQADGKFAVAHVVHQFAAITIHAYARTASWRSGM